MKRLTSAIAAGLMLSAASPFVFSAAAQMGMKDLNGAVKDGVKEGVEEAAKNEMNGGAGADTAGAAAKPAEVKAAAPADGQAPAGDAADGAGQAAPKADDGDE